MTNVQSQSLVFYFIIATIAVVFLYKWYSKVSAKSKDVYVVGYNKMIRAFRSGNLEQVKKLRRESQLVEPELYSAYKAGLKKAYADCIDPNKSVKEL